MPSLRQKFSGIKSTKIFRKWYEQELLFTEGFCPLCKNIMYTDTQSNRYIPKDLPDELRAFIYPYLITREYSVHVDHLLPLSKGGSNEYNNLMVCCANCNLRKGNKIAP